MKPYLTKLGVGSHWRYLGTRRQWKGRTWRVGRVWIVISSHRKSDYQ